MTVSEMLSRMSSSEFSEWMAYAQIEPFGEERQDVRQAIIACTVANSVPRKGRPYTVNDFMPKFRQPMTDDEIKNELLKLVRP